MTSIPVRVPIALGALALLAACGDKGKNDALNSDSTLSRDLAMAGQDTAARPQLTDVPKAPPPAAKSATKQAATKSKAATKTTPPPVAPPPAQPAAPRTGTIASGTQLALTAASEVCTNTHKVGDTFTATLKDPVAGSNGATIPAGAVVTLTITKLSRSDNVKDPIDMVFAVNSIEFSGQKYTVDAAVTTVAVDKVRNQPRSSDVKKVAGGAVIGAIAGQAIGKNTKGTLIGAAAGAAAGAGVAAATANYEGCVRNGAAIQVTLNAALTISVS